MRFSAILSGGALVSVVHSYAHYSDPSFKSTLRHSLERRKGGNGGGGGGGGSKGGGSATPGALIGDLVSYMPLSQETTMFDCVN
jgi:hypothetical protein